MTESGWLIEFKSSVYRQPHWWGRTLEGLGATPESLDAIRFARKSDADDVIADNGWTECLATEHIWGGEIPTMKRATGRTIPDLTGRDDRLANENRSLKEQVTFADAIIKADGESDLESYSTLEARLKAATEAHFNPHLPGCDHFALPACRCREIKS